jgi:O-antigen ligase
MTMSLGITTLGLGAIAIGLMLSLETLVVDILKEDLTFTGRTYIWQASTEMIAQRPWLGYGYKAFWNGMDGASAYVLRAVKWPTPDAHNGFIGLALDLGLVGLSIFLVGYFICLSLCVVKVRKVPGVDFIWPLSFLVCLILINIYEQSILTPNSILWVIYVAVSFNLLMPLPPTHKITQAHRGPLPAVPSYLSSEINSFNQNIRSP